MSSPQFSYPLLLGGLYGQYRQTAAQAQSSALAASYLAQHQAAARGLANPQFAGPATAAKLPPLESAGIRAGEIVGYRCWKLSNKGPLLMSVTAGHFWAPKETMSGDAKDYNGLGVHAFKTMTLALDNYYDSFVSQVFGSIYMWGDVIEHKHGWRAEFAAIRSLDLLLPRYRLWSGRRLVKLRKLYLE